MTNKSSPQQNLTRKSSIEDSELVAICTHCKCEKPLSAFHKKGRRHDSWCKSCRSVEKKNRYLQKKKKLLQQSKTRVLNLDNFTVDETILTEPTINHEQFEAMLENFVLDLLLNE